MSNAQPKLTAALSLAQRHGCLVFPIYEIGANASVRAEKSTAQA